MNDLNHTESEPANSQLFPDRRLSKKERIGLIIVFALLLLAILFMLIDWLRLDRFGFAQISYVDCVYIDNQIYYRGLDQYGSAVIESSAVGIKIGVVRFNLSEHVHNQN